MMVARSWLAFFVGMAAPVATAHDSWLVAVPIVAEKGSEFHLEFATGETFPISEHATDPARVAEWVYEIGGKKHAIETFAAEGQSLKASVRIDRPGLAVFGIALKPKYIELDAETFEKYLTEEYATAALAHWRTSRATGREYYTKLAKTLACVGDLTACGSADLEFGRILGFPLEIIPLSNPYTWKYGDRVAVRVLWRGKPAAGLRVSSGHDGLPEHTFVEQAVTDEEGIAHFTLSAPAPHWFLRTHRIEPINPPASRAGNDQPPGDWESWFSSISVVIRVPDDRVNPDAQIEPAKSRLVPQKPPGP